MPDRRSEEGDCLAKPDGETITGPWLTYVIRRVAPAGERFAVDRERRLIQAASARPRFPTPLRSRANELRRPATTRWRVARSMHAELVLDALEQALWSRSGIKGVVHHSDRGSQYLSIRYSERLAEAGAEPSVGSVGDSYDNALAETIIGLYKTELIHRRGPWRHLEAVEYATLEWVEWFNYRRLLEPIGNVPPAELEATYYHATSQLPMAA